MLHITEIRLDAGPVLTPGRLTVAIGPNNGGKSRFLRDLLAKLTKPTVPTVSVRNASIEARPSWLALVDALAGDARADHNGELVLSV